MDAEDDVIFNLDIGGDDDDTIGKENSNEGAISSLLLLRIVMLF